MLCFELWSRRCGIWRRTAVLAPYRVIPRTSKSCFDTRTSSCPVLLTVHWLYAFSLLLRFLVVGCRQLGSSRLFEGSYGLCLCLLRLWRPTGQCGRDWCRHCMLSAVVTSSSSGIRNWLTRSSLSTSTRWISSVWVSTRTDSLLAVETSRLSYVSVMMLKWVDLASIHSALCDYPRTDDPS